MLGSILTSRHRFRRPRSTTPKGARHVSPHHRGRSQSSSGTAGVKSGRRGHSPHSPAPCRDAELLKLILKHLNLKDLLRSRLVSKDWNELICDDEDFGLWSKGRLYFDATAAASADSTAKGKAQALTFRFRKFSQSSLIGEFKCPNYHFYFLDGRFEIVRKFFLDHGQFIHNLRLNNCILSLVSFQRILKSCPHLTVFEVTGMFHCMTTTESLFASKRESSLNGFINLRKLTFQSTYVARLTHLKIRKERRGGTETEVEIQDLHPTVVREILMSATKLESLTFSGFGISTVNRVLHNLSHYPFHHVLADLEFLDIPEFTSPSCLSEMDNLSHLKLRKFAMTFLGCQVGRNVVLNDDTGGLLQNLDRVLRNLLLAHQHTLESLDLTNCNVTEAIFLPSERLDQVPALRKLCLQGTQITELSENAKYVLRNYFDAPNAVDSSDEGNGPMSRTLIDDIVDTAIEDERCTLERCRPPGGGNDPTFVNCCNFDTICMAGAFALGILGAFFISMAWFGDTSGRSVFIAILFSILVMLAIFKIVITSLSD